MREHRLDALLLTSQPNFGISAGSIAILGKSDPPWFLIVPAEADASQLCLS